MVNITERLISGEPVYLFYDFEDVFVRTDSNDGLKYFMKFKGKSEFEADPSKSNLLMDALRSGEEISKEVYERA